MKPLLITLTLLAICLVAHAAPRIDDLPTVIVPVVGHAPALDGKLTDPAWTQAARVGPFVRMDGGGAKSRTEALLLRCGDTLYIGVKCEVPADAKLVASQKTRDGEVYQDDSVEVFIDPGVSLRKYLHFLVNSANVQRDERGDKGSDALLDASWNGNWKSATSRDDTAWYAEFAIGFADLNLPADAPAIIGLNVCRNDIALGESTCWSPTLSGFHEPARFGLAALPTAPASGGARLAVGAHGEPGIGSYAESLHITAGDATLRGLTGASISGNEGGRTETPLAIPEIPAGGSADVRCPYRFASAGSNAVAAIIKDASGRPVALAKSAYSVPESLNTTYGHRLPGGGKLGLWWAEGLYKIHREKPVPEATSDEVSLSAAGAEFEAVQLVLHPDRDLDATVQVSDFTGPHATIPAKSFTVREVDYVPVTTPTDSFGWAGDWPDPLPLLEGPLHCKAGVNQPIWLLAHVPADTPGGTYRGSVKIATGGETVSVPVRLRVYGFSLTEDTHTQSAYGVSPDFGFQGVSDPAQKREVFDLWMQDCRDHRIAPYTPMDLAGIDIKTLAPMRKLTLGRMAIEMDQSQASPWKLYWDGKQIASQQTSMTHFERKGLGWQGTGMSWPYVNGIESITEVSKSAGMRVYDVVATHAGSAECSRTFKMTIRLYIPTGDNWFAMKLYKFEGADPVEIEAREFFNIPQTTFKAAEVANGTDYSAWSGEGVGFGMICMGGGTGGFSISQGGQSVTVANPVTPFKMKQNVVRDGWGPLVVYFASDKTSAADLAARAEDLRQRITPATVEAYAPQQPMKVAEVTRSDVKFAYDFTEFDKAAKRYLDDFHFTAFNMPCMPDSIAGNQRFTPEFKRLHRLMYQPIIAHLKQHGWLDKAYAYWYDEPPTDAFPYVKEGAQTLKDNIPGLARLITKEPEPGLVGPINLWCPVLAAYIPERCHERQALGERVWWYVCCGPRAPYPNNFIDHPAINHRIRFWMMEKYNVTGSLYWATTYYATLPDGKPRNPWTYAMSHDPSGGCFGNGDGMLLYPPCREPSKTPVIAGPVPSMRWETLRDGLEDKEYFWTLRQEVARLQKMRASLGESRAPRGLEAALKQANDALGAPDRLADSLIKFSRDPQDLLRERERIATAIEACKRVR